MSVKNQVKIGLSFDLEYWYCGKILKKYLPEDKSCLPKVYPETTEKILNILAKNNASATFFILTDLAKENSELIKKINQAGHEVALHGLNHQLISEKTKDQFKTEIKEAKKIINDITGQEPIGFRAPNFSIFKKSLWALEVLIENNFIYDSSLYPCLIKKWGKVKTKPHRPLPSNDLIELPLATYKFFGFNIPLGGGFYFRVIPYTIFSLMLKKLAKNGQIPILYFHIIDLENFVPNLKMPWLLKKIKFWGVKKSFNKFEKLLQDFKTITMKEIYENYSYQSTN